MNVFGNCESDIESYSVDDSVNVSEFVALLSDDWIKSQLYDTCKEASLFCVNMYYSIS